MTEFWRLTLTIQASRPDLGAPIEGVAVTCACLLLTGTQKLVNIYLRPDLDAKRANLGVA
jgi:hypothetical protein